MCTSLNSPFRRELKVDPAGGGGQTWVVAEAKLWHLEHRVHISVVHAGDGEGGG